MNPQLTPDGRLHHLLTLDGLPRAILTQILDTAESFIDVGEREVKKVPLLRGKSDLQPVLRAVDAHPHHLRDRRQAAVRRRGQPQHRHLQPEQGRSDPRHRRQPRRRCMPTCSSCATAQSGAAHLIARHVAPHIPVVNAGDGRHAHPTQGLLDMFTIRRYKGDFHNLTRGHRRRRAAFARRALADPRADHAGRARSARDRPENPAADRRRADGRQGVPRHGSRPARMRRGHHAAPAERTHEGRAAALRAGIFQVLRPDPGKTRARQTRRHRDAPRPDEPRRGNRLRSGRRPAVGDPAAGDLRHRRAHGGDGAAAGTGHA